MVILKDIERDIASGDDDLEYGLWFDVLYPNWERGEYLFRAADDLALRFDRLLD